MKRIAFTGKFGSGKSTAANYLYGEYGFTVGSFAARLKEIATIACRMKEKDRELLQKLGSEIRKDAPNYWVDVLISKVKKHPGDFVIDDLRYKNELDILINNGFLIVRVVTPREVRFRRMGIEHPIEVTETERHPSETDLDDVQLLEVYNEGDTPHFYKSLDTIVKEYESMKVMQEGMTQTWPISL